MQVEAFYSIIKVVDYLRSMTEESIKFFKDNQFGEMQVDEEIEESESRLKPLSIDSIFVLKEHEIV